MENFDSVKMELPEISDIPKISDIPDLEVELPEIDINLQLDKNNDCEI